MIAQAGLRAAAADAGLAAIQRAVALRWWRQAVPVPLGGAPTLRGPSATLDLGGGDLLEVHRDDGGTYRAILVRTRGAQVEVRLLP